MAPLLYRGRQDLLHPGAGGDRVEKPAAPTGGKPVARNPSAGKAPPPAKAGAKKAEKVLRSTPKPGLKVKTGKVEKPKAAKAPAKAG